MSVSLSFTLPDILEKYYIYTKLCNNWYMRVRFYTYKYVMNNPQPVLIYLFYYAVLLLAREKRLYLFPGNHNLMLQQS